MKTERISRALEAFKATQAQRAYQKQTTIIEPTPTQPSDAVRLAADFGKSTRTADSGESESADRRAKFERIKSAVQSGTYSAPSGKVAESLIRDLGI